MQAFLKKVFRKDIVAIIQNILGLVRNFWLYNIMVWWENSKIWFQTVLTWVADHLHRLIFGNRLLIPIIIYQPGKVGSITVHQSLKLAFEKLGLSTPIYHTHNLNNIDQIEESILQVRKNPAATLKKLQDSRNLRQQIDSEPSQKWNIVSLVRDPVALRVSTLFQVLEEYIPDWAELTQTNKLSIQDLQDQLINRKEFDPIYLSGWFNNQVKDLFGFDVFSAPFDVKHGYKIYRAKRFSFMIIRLEDLNRVAPQAFQKFIRLNKLQVVNQNIGSDKAYSELYKKFKATPLPAEYLDAAYSTQYARHFYTPEELAGFRNRWLHPEPQKER